MGEPAASCFHSTTDLKPKRRQPALRVRGIRATRSRSERNCLASLRCIHHLHGHRLTFAKAGEAGALEHRDVHEHVLATVIGGNEAEALLAVEPLHLAADINGRGGVRSLARCARRTRAAEAAAPATTEPIATAKAPAAAAEAAAAAAATTATAEARAFRRGLARLHIGDAGDLTALLALANLHLHL